MTYFLGEYPQSIDPKNRIFIPSKFREALGEGAKVFIVPNDRGGLSAYSEEGFAVVMEKITSLPTDESASISEFIFTSAEDVKPDSQGRVVLTQKLRDHAGLDHDIYILGLGNRIEIWDKLRWEERCAQNTSAKVSALSHKFQI